MKNMRWWGLATFLAATTAVGCCSWAERNCPHACPANNCCPAPCQPACCPAPANYQSGGGWSNPTGAPSGCCNPNY
ncbi:MAG TPA: hypothetical protein VGG61_07760 [Gemmataceae bacterium]|jgi:hypothetical protein